ncbi:MAG: hypothetical protein LBF70_00650 [Holosporales bacterium]|jgi:hypothetical protein|nr:hypothetical protein [Holosporales bacterium]
MLKKYVKIIIRRINQRKQTMQLPKKKNDKLTKCLRRWVTIEIMRCIASTAVPQQQPPHEILTNPHPKITQESIVENDPRASEVRNETNIESDKEMGSRKIKLPEQRKLRMNRKTKIGPIKCYKRKQAYPNVHHYRIVSIKKISTRLNNQREATEQLRPRKLVKFAPNLKLRHRGTNTVTTRSSQ